MTSTKNCDCGLKSTKRLAKRLTPPSRFFFAMIWRLETYVVEPRFVENGFEDGKCEQQQLVVDDFFTCLVDGIRAKTKELLLEKVLKAINEQLFI